MWIDGASKGSATGDATAISNWAGSGAASFASAAHDGRIPAGEPNLDWPGGADAIVAGLLVYMQVNTRSTCDAPQLTGAWEIINQTNLNYICCNDVPNATSTTQGPTATPLGSACDPGYTGGADGGKCTACPEGKYKAAAGTGNCSACPAWATSPVASDNVTDCTCNTGYTGPDGGECTACPAGTYKDTAGSAECSSCPSNSTSPAASGNVTDCVCDAGYTGSDGDQCTACVAGKYKDTAGSAECSDCPSYASSPLASDNATDCTCVKGYTGPDGMTCAACVAGTYKDVNGSSLCSQCSQGTYMESTGASGCKQCPSNSSSPVGASLLAHCACNAGYTGGMNGGQCTACDPGFAKAVNGTSPCEICQRGSFSVAGRSACSLCAANTFNNRLGASSCMSCQAPAKSSRGSQNVSACTIDVVAIEGVFLVAGNVSEFEANVGLYQEGLADLGAGGDLDAVEMLSWRSSAGSTRRLLAASSGTVQVEFRVTVPRYDVQQAEISLQGLGAWAIAQGLSTTSIASVHVTCGAGSEVDPAYEAWNASYGQLLWPYTANGSNHSRPDRCRMCPTGRYKQVADDSLCVACPDHSSTRVPGAFLVQECECERSFFSIAPLSANESCHMCGEGHFCPGLGERIACAPGSYTVAGIFNYSSPCTLCEAMTFKSAAGPGTCSPCPARMESAAGSALCSCQAGFSGPLGGPCGCASSSGIYLEADVDDDAALIASDKSVTLRVYNVSAAGRQLCGSQGVSCVPFLVYFSVDGTEPSKNGSLACDGWRADKCQQQWGTGYQLRLSGGNLVRALALKQGYHVDACLEFGENVSSFPPESAARLCNSPTAPAGVLVQVLPDLPTVLIYPKNASETTSKSCVCRHQDCCTAALGAGELEVALAQPTAQEATQLVHELRFSVCVPPAPTRLNGTTCAQPADLSLWSLYSEPLVFPVRSLVSVFTFSASRFGAGALARAVGCLMPQMPSHRQYPFHKRARRLRARVLGRQGAAQKNVRLRPSDLAMYVNMCWVHLCPNARMHACVKVQVSAARSLLSKCQWSTKWK